MRDGYPLVMELHAKKATMTTKPSSNNKIENYGRFKYSIGEQHNVTLISLWALTFYGLSFSIPYHIHPHFIGTSALKTCYRALDTCVSIFLIFLVQKIYLFVLVFFFIQNLRLYWNYALFSYIRLKCTIRLVARCEKKEPKEKNGVSTFVQHRTLAPKFDTLTSVFCYSICCCLPFFVSLLVSFFSFLSVAHFGLSFIASSNVINVNISTYKFPI